MKRKTAEEYCKEVYDLVGDEYEVLEDYVKAGVKILVHHKVCSAKYKIEPTYILRGRRCPNCPHGKKKTNETFIKEVYELVGGEYNVLNPYKYSDIKVQFEHTVCGLIYEATPNAFLTGGRCPRCNGNEGKRKTTEQFKEEVYALVGGEYVVTGEYVNRATNIGIKHTTCGRSYYVEPGNFLYGSRCVECHYNDRRLTPDQVDEYILESLGEDYYIVSEYKSMQTPITIHHNVCGYDFNTRLTDVVQKRVGCKVCSQSRGEEYISNYLRSKNLEYTLQKRFDDLKDISYLFYDFFLPNQGILIEYQGEQHFRPKNFGGTTPDEAHKNFVSQQRRDQLKRDYAKTKGYTLLAPDYKLDTYSKVVKYLNKHIQ